MSTERYFVLLAIIMLAAGIAAPTDKEEAALLSSGIAGVLLGLAIGSWLFW